MIFVHEQHNMMIGQYLIIYSELEIYLDCLGIYTQTVMCSWEYDLYHNMFFTFFWTETNDEELEQFIYVEEKPRASTYHHLAM